MKDICNYVSHYKCIQHRDDVITKCAEVIKSAENMKRCTNYLLWIPKFPSGML